MFNRVVACSLLILLAVPQLLPGADPHGTEVSKWAADRMEQAASNQPLRKQLSQLVIPRLEVEDIALADLLKLLRLEARKADPEGKGFNLFVKCRAESLKATVSLDLTNVPVSEILHMVQLTSGVQFVYERYAVVVMDKPPPTE